MASIRHPTCLLDWADSQNQREEKQNKKQPHSQLLQSQSQTELAAMLKSTWCSAENEYNKSCADLGETGKWRKCGWVCQIKHFPLQRSVRRIWGCLHVAKWRVIQLRKIKSARKQQFFCGIGTIEKQTSNTRKPSGLKRVAIAQAVTALKAWSEWDLIVANVDENENGEGVHPIMYAPTKREIPIHTVSTFAIWDQ